LIIVVWEYIISFETASLTRYIHAHIYKQKNDLFEYIIVVDKIDRTDEWAKITTREKYREKKPVLVVNDRFSSIVSSILS